MFFSLAKNITLVHKKKKILFFDKKNFLPKNIRFNNMY